MIITPHILMVRHLRFLIIYFWCFNSKSYGTSIEWMLAISIPLHTGKGHYSRSVDNKPRNSIFIPVPDDFVAQDC